MCLLRNKREKTEKKKFLKVSSNRIITKDDSGENCTVKSTEDMLHQINGE